MHVAIQRTVEDITNVWRLHGVGEHLFGLPVFDTVLTVGGVLILIAAVAVFAARMSKGD